MIRRICVFCGASAGTDPIHVRTARDLGRLLAERGIGLVYGGGKVGLMGAVADAALEAGGEVIGVIPRRLVEAELAHPDATEMRITETLHERKAQMAALADAFIALPGGLGTLEELSEVASQAQLRLHRKPIGILDVSGYYGGLLAHLDGAVAAGFLAPAHRAILLVETTAEALLDRLVALEPPGERPARAATLAP